jgi:hypothetical protein
MRTIRIFLIVQIALFVLAALIHSGILVTGHRHHQARIAESVIAVVLGAGLLSTAANSASMKVIPIAAQAFALLGTVVGISTIIIGIGPRSMLDAALHICMTALLIVGLTNGYRALHSNTV